MTQPTPNRTRSSKIFLALGGLWLVISCLGLGLALRARVRTPYLGLVIEKYSKTVKGWKVRQVPDGSPAHRAGVARGWVLISVGGLKLDRIALVAHPDHLSTAAGVRQWWRWQERIREKVGQGRPVLLLFKVPGAGEARIEVTPTFSPGWMVARHTWLLVLVGLAFAGLGLLTVYLRPGSPSARRLLWWCLIIQAFEFMLGLTEFPRLLAIPSIGGRYFYGLHDLLFFLGGVAIFHFCVTFLDLRWRGRGAVLAAMYTAAVGVGAAYTLRFVSSLFLAFPPGLYVACVVLLVIRYVRSPAALAQRKQIKWLLWGLGVPAAVLMLLHLLVYGLQLHATRETMTNLGTVCILVFPVATAMAILRHRLFDIDLVVRRSLVAAVVLPLLLLGYAWVVDLVGGALAAGGLPTVLLVTVLVLIMLLPGQLRVEEAVGRLLGLNRYAGRAALAGLAAGLAESESLEDVAGRVADGVREALELQNAVLYLSDAERKRMAVAAVSGTFEEPPRELPPSVLERLAAADAGSVFPEEFFQPEELAKHLGRPGPILVLPVRTSTRVLGLLAVGRRVGRRSLSGDEFRALENLAGGVAMAADRALHQELLHRLKSMQAQIIQAGRMAALGTLAAGVAHELNTPLGYVAANAQLIERKLKELAETEGSGKASAVLVLARDIREGADQMSEVVGNMRSFAQLDRKGREMVDPNQCVRQSLRLMSNSIPPEVSVDCRLEPVPSVPGHPAQLNQVVVNLISNACQAMEGRGTITVRTWTGDGNVCLRVLDEGTGVSEEVKEKAFDPFFTGGPVGRGMGLGLTISRAVVEAHDGRLNLENRDDGNQGAQATVFLPLNRPTAQEKE